MLLIFLAGAGAASAQYPSQSQISKDGTAVLLEDYATPPLSSGTHGGSTETANQFQGTIGAHDLAALGTGEGSFVCFALFCDRRERHNIHPRQEQQNNSRHTSGFLRFSRNLSSDGGLAHRGRSRSRSIPTTRRMGNFIPCISKSPSFQGPRRPRTAAMPSLDLTGIRHHSGREPSGGPGAPGIRSDRMDGQEYSQRDFRGDCARTSAGRL